MGFEKDGVFPSNVGSLYSIGSDLIIKKQVTPVSISNGLAWNSNNDTLYYIDSLTYQIVAYNYDSQTGTICKSLTVHLIWHNMCRIKWIYTFYLFFIANKKTVFDLQKNNIPGLPDGMTIDTDENLWVAVFGGGGVSIIMILMIIHNCYKIYCRGNNWHLFSKKTKYLMFRFST